MYLKTHIVGVGVPPIGWAAVHVQRDEQINIDENETIEDHIVKLRSSQTILWMILWWIEWRTLMAMRKGV